MNYGKILFDGKEADKDITWERVEYNESSRAIVSNIVPMLNTQNGTLRYNDHRVGAEYPKEVTFVRDGKTVDTQYVKSDNVINESNSKKVNTIDAMEQARENVGTYMIGGNATSQSAADFIRLLEPTADIEMPNIDFGLFYLTDNDKSKLLSKLCDAARCYGRYKNKRYVVRPLK